MQQRGSTNASAAGLVPVSQTQVCATKEAAATRCALTFRGGDLTADYDQGQPLYLGFEATNVTQVRRAPGRHAVL